jgi:hypothetical protein
VSTAADTHLWPLATVLPRVVAADEPDPAAEDDDRETEALALGARWQEELDDAVIAWGQQVSHEQYAAAVDAVEAAVRASDVEALAALAVPVLGEDLLLASMTTMYGEGADFVVTEAADQGVKIRPAKPEAILHPWLIVKAAATGASSGQTIGAWARAIVARIAARVSAGLSAEAMRLFRPGVKASEVTDGLQTYWDGLTDAVPREHIGAGLSRAVNLGKLDTYAIAKPRGWTLELRADERLDRNTCEPCRKIDGTVLPDRDAAGLAYGGAGYLFCKGRERCRGTCRGIWINKTKNGLDPATLRNMLGTMAREMR